MGAFGTCSMHRIAKRSRRLNGAISPMKNLLQACNRIKSPLLPEVQGQCSSSQILKVWISAVGSSVGGKLRRIRGAV